MRRERRFWIMLSAWILLGLPVLIGTAWLRSDGLPIPDPPKAEKGFIEVIGWVGIVGLVYLTPIFLFIDEVRYRRARRTQLRH